MPVIPRRGEARAVAAIPAVTACNSTRPGYQAWVDAVDLRLVCLLRALGCGTFGEEADWSFASAGRTSPRQAGADHRRQVGEGVLEHPLDRRRERGVGGEELAAADGDAADQRDGDAGDGFAVVTRLRIGWCRCAGEQGVGDRVLEAQQRPGRRFLEQLKRSWLVGEQPRRR